MILVSCLFRFDTFIYKDQPEVFEDKVLKRLPQGIEIHFADKKDDFEQVGELNEWLKLYNITYLRSCNTSIVGSVHRAKALKCLYLRNMVSAEMIDPLFRKGTKAHVLAIYFARAMK